QLDSLRREVARRGLVGRGLRHRRTSPRGEPRTEEAKRKQRVLPQGDLHGRMPRSPRLVHRPLCPLRISCPTRVPWSIPAVSPSVWTPSRLEQRTDNASADAESASTRVPARGGTDGTVRVT